MKNWFFWVFFFCTYTIISNFVMLVNVVPFHLHHYQHQLQQLLGFLFLQWQHWVIDRLCLEKQINWNFRVDFLLPARISSKTLAISSSVSSSRSLLSIAASTASFIISLIIPIWKAKSKSWYEMKCYTLINSLENCPDMAWNCSTFINWAIERATSLLFCIIPVIFTLARKRFNQCFFCFHW